MGSTNFLMLFANDKGGYRLCISFWKGVFKFQTSMNQVRLRNYCFRATVMNGLLRKNLIGFLHTLSPGALVTPTQRDMKLTGCQGTMGTERAVLWVPSQEHYGYWSPQGLLSVLLHSYYWRHFLRLSLPQNSSSALQCRGRKRQTRHHILRA